MILPWCRYVCASRLQCSDIIGFLLWREDISATLLKHQSQKSRPPSKGNDFFNSLVEQVSVDADIRRAGKDRPAAFRHRHHAHRFGWEAAEILLRPDMIRDKRILDTLLLGICAGPRKLSAALTDVFYAKRAAAKVLNPVNHSGCWILRPPTVPLILSACTSASWSANSSSQSKIFSSRRI